MACRLAPRAAEGAACCLARYPAAGGCFLVLLVLDQFGIGQSLPNPSADHGVHPLLAAHVGYGHVGATLELGQIAIHVLDAPPVVHALVAALEDGPHALDAVGVGYAATILSLVVVDCLVVEQGG